MNNTATAATKPAVTATKSATRVPLQKEKTKAIAFVNWRIAGKDGETLLRSSKGFPIFDNEFTSLEEKALVELAKQHGDTATVMAEMRIIIAQEKPESLDISKIQVMPKKQA